MGRGWSVTESTGVWSEGPSAELVFRFETKPANSLLARFRVTPFMQAGPQCVTISLKNTSIAQWSFTGPQDIYPEWRELKIPSDLLGDNEMLFTLQIGFPASPEQVGVSDDVRRLGVMLHEMSIDDASRASLPSDNKRDSYFWRRTASRGQ
jgi:hypothetical protein